MSMFTRPMSSGFLCVPLAFVLELFIPLALGGETELDRTPDDPQSLKSIIPDTANICGEPEIWRKLTGDPSVEGVQNIKWKKIEEMMADHVTAKAHEISVLELEIEQLKNRAAQKRIAEAAKPVPLADMTTLVMDGIAPFKDSKADALKNAQDTMCGKPALTKGEIRRANRACAPKFKAAADAYYSKDEGVAYRMDLDAFLAECKRLLPAGNDPFASYCPTLCQRFTTYAEEKNQAAGETGGRESEELIRDMEEKSKALAAAKTSKSDCEAAQEFISGFGKQITTQKKKIDARFTDYQDAEMNLADAQEQLQDLTDNLANEEQLLEDAKGALEKSTADTSALEAQIAALLAEEARLAKEMDAVTSTLESTSSKLWAAKEADKVVIELKGVVAAVALKMRMYFKEVVLKPLDEIGLGEAVDMQKYVEPNIAELASAKKMVNVLTELDTFCNADGPAVKSFKAVADKMDLSPLCKIKPAQQIFQELLTQVARVRESIKKDTQQLQTWFDPLKGQSEMTPAKVEEFVTLGEPKNLREIIGVFSRTQIFRSYLKEWQLKGKFTRLIAKLKDIVSALDKSFQELSAKVKQLGLDIPATKAKRADAQKALDEAIAKKQADTTTVSELKKTVAGMKESFATLSDDTRHLQEEVEKARKAWEASKTELLKQHSEAVSLMELLSDAEETIGELDTSAVDTAKDELAKMKIALRDAESQYEAVKGQLRVLAQ